MTLSSLLSAAGPKPRLEANALNARLARTLPSTMNSPHPPYTFSSSPLSSSPLPSSSPPTEFVTPLSPPVPEIGKARLEPHSPKLRELDKIYERSEHPLLDGFRFIGAGGVGNPWPKEKREKRGEEGELDEDDDAIGPMVEDMNDGLEVRTKKAMRVLENHIKDRMPFVRLSSQRLQAVMGVRNELAFNLPEIKRSTSYINIWQPDPIPSLDAAGSAARTLARSPFGFLSNSPLSSPQVDPSTGKGLREWLLSKGKEFGMRKKECKSISFHDFTPDMRNNNWSNKLLGHFAVGEGLGARERVDFYEVDLPTTTPDPTTGGPITSTQTWLWFLISRHLLTVSAKNTSTRPPSHSKISHPSSVQSTPSHFYTPSAYPSSSPSPHHPQSEDHSQNFNLPPNFPQPVPTSWMVIACPLENVTVYPELVESSPSTSASTTASAHSLSTRNRNKFPFQNGGAKKAGSKKIYKRCDFDFSHNGTPLFEFNSNTMSQWKGELPPFLEVGELGPFYDGDEYEMMDDREYAEMVKEGMGKGLDWMGQEIEGERKVVSPFAGQWWKVFYEGVSRDAARWCSIRSAMSRGKCRVVVRYTEFEDDYEGQDVEMEGGLFGLGIDLEGSAGGFKGGEGKKIKERLVGRQRLTRSETRRRSGLGMSEVSSSGVVIGVGSAGNGLGESGRSRAVGNKELGASVGKGGKGKGVVKK